MNLPDDLVYSPMLGILSFLLSNLTSSVAASAAPRVWSQIYVTSPLEDSRGAQLRSILRFRDSGTILI